MNSRPIRITRMMRQMLLLCFAGSALAVAVPAQAASKPIVYPANGQSTQQQREDEDACYGWATQNTGVDPERVASSPATVSNEPQGERVRGAAKGAVGGAVVGAVAGDAGKGAAIGAVAGTLVGGRQARQNRAAAQQSANSKQQASLNTFNRAYSACLEGRGYTVK